jgi:hypothetical protein
VALQTYELLYSSTVSQLLIVVAELGVADHVADGAQRVEELADETGSQAGALYRALRALASVGVVRRDGSRRGLARYVGLPACQQPFAALGYSVRTGRPAFEQVHGRDGGSISGVDGAEPGGHIRIDRYKIWR